MYFFVPRAPMFFSFPSLPIEIHQKRRLLYIFSIRGEGERVGNTRIALRRGFSISYFRAFLAMARKKRKGEIMFFFFLFGNVLEKIFSKKKEQKCINGCKRPNVIFSFEKKCWRGILFMIWRRSKLWASKIKAKVYCKAFRFVVYLG